MEQHAAGWVHGIPCGKAVSGSDQARTVLYAGAGRRMNHAVHPVAAALQGHLQEIFLEELLVDTLRAELQQYTVYLLAVRTVFLQ